VQLTFGLFYFIQRRKYGKLDFLKPNPYSKLSLEEKGQLVAERILISSNMTMENLYKQESFKNITNEISWKIYTEFLMFLMHISDRNTFSLLGNSDKRDKFIDAVMDTIIEKELASKSSNISDEEFRSNFINTSNNRQKEYSKYKIDSSKEESLEGTILWEFGKKISCIANGSSDIVIIMYASGLATTCIKEINLKEILEV